MKCEICHKAEAETAITRGNDDEELYVCKACASKEKFDEDGEMEEPPPFIGALINAVEGFASDIETMRKEIADRAEKRRNIKWLDFPVERIASEFRFCNRLHLEGLCLIGELDAVIRAVRALKMELVGINCDNLTGVGHIYRLQYTNPNDCVRHVLNRIIAEEHNARVRLLTEDPRVFGDAISRALAILKVCRMLSPGEMFDMLSPLYLAAQEKMLVGVTAAQIARLAASLKVNCSDETDISIEERDQIDARRADKVNRLFANVTLTRDAEEMFHRL